MIYLKTFKLSDSKITNNNIYPFNVLQNKEPDIFIFDNITVLYGNNGSGKSTILNIIAHKLDLKGKHLRGQALFRRRCHFWGQVYTKNIMCQWGLS